MKRNSALFILKTRDGRKITQACLDSVVTDVTQLVKQNLQHVCHRAVQTLRETGVSEECVARVQSVILDDESSNIFEGLETEYRQNSIFRDSFGLVVSTFIALYIHCIHKCILLGAC